MSKFSERQKQLEVDKTSTVKEKLYQNNCINNYTILVNSETYNKLKTEK